jgi:hypothetical protein
MRRSRPLLAAVLAGIAVLVVPIGLQARPKAVQQPRNGQRVVNNLLLQLQVQKRLQHRKRHHAISGTVVSVHHNKSVPGTGSITLSVHRHRRKNNQNVAAAGVKKAQCQRRAMAIGQQKKRQSQTVKVRYGRGTKFAVTVKGLFNNPVTKTVGSGKAKTKIVVNQMKVQTKNLPSHVRHVQKGQKLRIVLHDSHQLHNAKAVHILHASVLAKNN